jgi:PAS domain S-box-containing protein
MRALLVPTQDMDTSPVERLLRQHRFSPICAGDEETAMAVFQEAPFPLVLVGLDDEGDRVVLVRALRAAPRGAQASVVMLVRPEQVERLQPLLEAGADDFLVLPLEESSALLRLRLAERRVAERPAPDSPATQSTLDGLCDLLLRESPVPTCIITREEGAFVEVNDAFIQAFGYERKELLWRTPQEMGAWETPADKGRVLELFHSHGSVRGLEVRLRSKSGEIRQVILYAGMAEYAGTPHVVAMLPDITERRQMQARLLLSDRMASMGTLAAGVAHEINNPLAYVTANLAFAHEELRSLVEQRWQKDSSPVTALTESLKGARQALDEALMGAERVRTIVSDLKTFSRESQEVTASVNVHQVLDTTLNLASGEIRHRARLVKAYGDVPLVRGNESRMGQVFLNLLVNAAQAIPEGEPDLNEIRVTTRPGAGSQVVVEVTDTGGGIAPELLGRIFDPFFTTKPPGVGTGLGLSICHNLITAMGGEIHVSSQVGRGTTFQVVLPMATGPADVAVKLPVPVVTRGPRGRVLVIDDEPMLCAALERILRPHHDVVHTTVAAEALPRLEAGERFDLILCDLMMPRMSGMDFHAALCRLRPDLSGRVIFLTGGAFTPQARAFLESVPNRRVEKPFNAHALLAVTQEVLADRQ